MPHALSLKIVGVAEGPESLDGELVAVEPLVEGGAGSAGGTGAGVGVGGASVTGGGNT